MVMHEKQTIHRPLHTNPSWRCTFGFGSAFLTLHDSRICLIYLLVTWNDHFERGMTCDPEPQLAIHRWYLNTLSISCTAISTIHTVYDIWILLLTKAKPIFPQTFFMTLFYVEIDTLHLRKIPPHKASCKCSLSLPCVQECDCNALSELLLCFHLINYALSHIHASLTHSKECATESWALGKSRGGLRMAERVEKSQRISQWLDIYWDSDRTSFFEFCLFISTLEVSFVTTLVRNRRWKTTWPAKGLWSDCIQLVT